MANTSSAQKAERVALRRAVYNARRKKTMKDSIKSISRLIAARQPPEAANMLPSFYQAIDKAVKGRIIKKNAAARMKSRVTKRLAAISK